MTNENVLLPCREAFEKWYGSNPEFGKYCYTSNIVQARWEAWQAAWEFAQPQTVDGDTQAALDAIFLTICPTTTWPSGEECQQGRITLEQYNIIRAALTAQQPDVNQELLGALKGIDAMIRQKKGFYAISVGHDPVKIAHKTGVNKGLDVVQQIVKQSIARAEKK